MFSERLESADPESMSLNDGISYIRQGIKDARHSIQDSTSLQIRYYAALPLILAPLLVFRKRRVRKLFYSYALVSYFVVPEPIRAILNAK